MAIAMKGLKLKPKYEDLINVAVSDGPEHIKSHNRNALFLRNGFVLSQLRRRRRDEGDGKTTRTSKQSII